MDVAIRGILNIHQRLVCYPFVLQNGIIRRWWAQGLPEGPQAITNMAGRSVGF